MGSKSSGRTSGIWHDEVEGGKLCQTVYRLGVVWILKDHQSSQIAEAYDVLCC